MKVCTGDFEAELRTCWGKDEVVTPFRPKHVAGLVEGLTRLRFHGWRARMSDQEPWVWCDMLSDFGIAEPIANAETSPVWVGHSRVRAYVPPDVLDGENYTWPEAVNGGPFRSGVHSVFYTPQEGSCRDSGLRSDEKNRCLGAATLLGGRKGKSAIRRRTAWPTNTRRIDENRPRQEKRQKPLRPKKRKKWRSWRGMMLQKQKLLRILVPIRKKSTKFSPNVTANLWGPNF